MRLLRRGRGYRLTQAIRRRCRASVGARETLDSVRNVDYVI